MMSEEGGEETKNMENMFYKQLWFPARRTR